MEKILLVEPNYKNKYPPIGLMKIATYFKNKGDFVEFHKGLLPKIEVIKFDKVMITTLFTFDFKMCIQTIKYYIAIVGIEKVFVGGIAISIMPENFIKEIPNLKILTGQLTSSNILGYKDNVNIDILELDYDILWDISYNYPAADSYFVYTTRGCPRKCSFCAVKTLEPKFYDCNNIVDQISNVDLKFGVKKNLLIMDNNILYSKQFNSTIDILYNLGFGYDNNKVKKSNAMKYFLKSLRQRINKGNKYTNLLIRIKDEFNKLNFNRISKVYFNEMSSIVNEINNKSDKEIVNLLLDKEKIIVNFFEKYNYQKITRHVDFNQGLDARLFTKEKADELSKIALKPCRIAFDDLNMRDSYFKAMNLAVNSGIRNFSNYLLYNYEDSPEDLWTRLNLNVKFCSNHKDKKLNLFSFPMKYASIVHTDRKYVGEHWNRKFLRAINVILNVTSGVVAKEEDFFYRAFGKNEKNFIEILTMPDDFIRYRSFFEKIGFTGLWKKYYLKLTESEIECLLKILDCMVENPSVLENKHTNNVDNILIFYKIKKKNIDKEPLYYSNLLKTLENIVSK